MHRKDSDGYRALRATFPYLVFITVFVIAMAGVMYWAHGAVPAPRLAAPTAPAADARPRPAALRPQDLLEVLRSQEPGVSDEALRLGAVLGPQAIDTAGPRLLSDSPREARLAAIALDGAVYRATRPVEVANALFRLLGGFMSSPDLSDDHRRDLCGKVLTWAGAVATDAHAPALQALLEDPVLARDALALLARIPGPAALEALLAALAGSQYPVELRLEAARILGERPEGSVIRPLLAASAGKPSPLGWACLDALAHHGVTPEQVFPLPPTADHEEIRRYGQAVLTAADRLAEQGRDPIAQRLCLGVLAHDAPPALHRAALQSLARLHNPDILAVALGALGNPGVRAAAIDALAVARSEGLDDALDKACEQVDAPSRAALLEVMHRRGHPALDARLAEARDDGNVELRVTARRLLGEEPSDEDLLTLAARGNPWMRARARGAYLARAEALLRAGEAESAAGLFRALLEADVSPEASAAGLRGLARAGRHEDVPLFEARLEEPALAAMAWPLLTDMLVADDDRDRARAALARILPRADTDGQRALVENALRTLGTTAEEVFRAQGYLTRWRVLGPLPNRDGSAFGKPFYPASRAQVGPVQLDGTWFDWAGAEAEGLPALLDLATRWGDGPDMAAYAVAEVAVDEDTPVSLRLETGGPVECWLNGEPLLARRRAGPEPLCQGFLRPGLNRVLVKTLRTEEAWTLGLQLTRDGVPLNVVQPR